MLNLTIKLALRSSRLACGILFVLAHATHAQTLMFDAFDDCDDVEWRRIDGFNGKPWGPTQYELVPEASGDSCSYRLASSDIVTDSGELFSGYTYSAWQPAVSSDYDNGYVRLRAVIETQGTGVGIGMRNVGSAYTMGLNSANGHAWIVLADGTATPASLDGIAYQSGYFSQADTWWLQAGADGPDFSLKYWKAGEPEPLLPQLTATDETFG
ncbi:MAG: hypothetical protein KDA92_26190, partial [Planctomycetales bacterium]|nr:hypothetical protein [Planctomycetales bacterium]